MSFSLNCPLRRLSTPASRWLRVPNERRWAQVHRFLATGEQPRAVVERYRAKLDRKAREKGVEGFEGLKSVYADKIADVRKEPSTDPTEGRPATTTTKTESPLSKRSPTAGAGPSLFSSSPDSGSTMTAASGVKPLSAILDLDKARALPEKELSAVWRLRHASDASSLCAVIPAATYRAMEEAARATPQFVLPVPHAERGAEVHFLQWTFDAATGTASVLFTQLAEYKVRGEFAQPHTTVTHHADLADGPAGVVLMHGQMVEGRGARIEDARFLVMCLQKFYGGWDAAGGDRVTPGGEDRKRLLEWFSKGDQRFTIEKLLEETERLA